MMKTTQIPKTTEQTPVAHQFENSVQQKEAVTLGMWVFLATEVLFFGGLITAYTVYRFKFNQAFELASEHLSIVFGAADTAVLLTSSLTMVLAVYAIQTQKSRKVLTLFLVLSAMLGATFLVMHGMEYYHDYLEHHIPGRNYHFEGKGSAPHFTEIFFVLYFITTGLHSLHVLIGIGILLTLAVLAWRGYFQNRGPSTIEVAGLYWHFVDIVWVFLFPLFYLIAKR